MSMLVADGVLPANEGRGYVLRRVVRRAVLAARRLGVETSVTPVLVGAATEVLGRAYPALIEHNGVILAVLEREEAGFDRTLRAGLGRLEEAFATGEKVLGGDVAFTLHDTHGFPVELTEELAHDAGVEVDRAGFDAAMAAQRSRARASARSARAGDESAYRALLESEGTTQFVGRTAAQYEVPARIVGLLSGSDPGADPVVEIFLDQTPFYAEGGGQVGDTGTIVTGTGRAEVYDTVYALPGLIAHKARVTGELVPGQDALAAIDVPRREAIRRNHTATHLLHAALRTVLGDHVRQQGSLVAPDRLRFDFSHHGAMTTEELDAVFALANDAVLTDAPVETTETSLQEAERMGALRFFDDKYGETVRVIQAGGTSLEFCGGTHVDSLGQIGPISLVSEESIGSNKRRIFAVTGRAALDRATAREHLIRSVADLLRTDPDDLLASLDRLLARQREAEKELSKLRQQSSESVASELAKGAEDGVVVARQNSLEPDALRSLAQAVHRHDGVRAVALGGSPDGAKVALVVVSDGEPNATDVVRALGAIVGGGGGGSPQLAVAGGKDVSRLDEALAEARRLLSA
jgi:alanyl-tRNA synthetase